MHSLRCSRLFATAAAVALAAGWIAAAAEGPPQAETAPSSPRGRGSQLGSSAAPIDESAAASPTSAAAKTGLFQTSSDAFPGYTLFAPLGSTTTYRIDLSGNVVHTWPSRYEPGQAVYLLDDGSLLRCAREPDNEHFGGGGIGGRVERLAPDGQVLWHFVYADEKHCLHHDIEPLPNGNILMIAWEKRSRDEAVAAGMNPDGLPGDEVWPDCVIEVEPAGTVGGKIVWEWHAWDHLVQELDASKANYGRVREHPERIDANYQRRAPRETPDEIRRLRALGYIGGGDAEAEDERDPGLPFGPGGPDLRADLYHTNSIAYNARLDQIALSVHSFNEVWIIDHGTTPAEAAGHTGGRQGRGGDLLYRWGNPRAYGAGAAADQQLFAQHDAHWIPEGSPGAGRLMIFNNGTGRTDGEYSSVIEIAPPLDAKGQYTRPPGAAFGPERPEWEYAAPNRPEFFSGHISGAERLSNGNTLICDGEQGRIFEVTPDGRTVWDYVNPFVERRRPDGPGGFSPPGLGPPPPWMFDGPPPDVFDRPPPRSQPSVSRSELGRTHPASRPRHRPPFPPPPGVDGPRGPRGGPPFPPPFMGRHGPPGGGPAGAGLFRATRLAESHPGIQKLLQSQRPS